jgi:hypothetical protein
MGEWKAQLSVRVRQTLRAEIEEFAATERRTVSNVSEFLLEWSIGHLKAAGSTEELVRTLPRAEQSQGDSVTAQKPKENDRIMVPERFQIGLRIRPALMIELEEIANRENKTLGIVTVLFLEWGYEQLKAAGTRERLRRCGIPFTEKEAQPIRATARSRVQEPKAPMAPGVRDEVWRRMKEIALREDKNLGQLAELLLQWSVLQLRAAGSTDRLPKHQLRPVSRQLR